MLPDLSQVLQQIRKRLKNRVVFPDQLRYCVEGFWLVTLFSYELVGLS